MMSTLGLTSSPSPALSPRQSLHSTHPSRGATLLPSSSSIASTSSSSGSGSAHGNNPLYHNHHHSSGNRVGPSATPSPRQLAPPTTISTITTTTTAAAAAVAAITSTADNQPSPRVTKYFHSNEHDAPPYRRVRYIDSATQYSPECSPPTANAVSDNSKNNRPRVSNIPAVASAATAAVTTAVASTPVEVAQHSDSMTDVVSSSTATSSLSHIANAGGSSSAAQNGSPTQATPNYHGHHYNGPRAVPTSAMPESSPLQEARSTDVQPSASKRARPDPATWKVMPYKYELCGPKDLGALIANMLMELIRINDKIPLRDGRLTRFHSRAPPGISVSDYLQRLIQHATLSPPILLSMVYYIDRLCTMYPAFTINSLTVHRFLITAATVAAKGLSDSFWTNPTYARIGGIPVPELATLELELLQRVQWKIVPRPEALEDYYYSLVDRTDGYVLEQAASGSESGRSTEDSSTVLTNSQEPTETDRDGDAEMEGGPT